MSSQPQPDGISAVLFQSKLGWMVVVWNDYDLRELTFGHHSARHALRALRTRVEIIRTANRAKQELVGRLQEFAEGAIDQFLDVSLEMTGLTQFRRKVIRQCRRIPYGSTISYSQLASRAGSPRAARAVGNTMAANPFPLIVPCHRVTGAGGTLGGYSAPDGLALKKRLLLHETNTLRNLTGNV